MLINSPATSSMANGLGQSDRGPIGNVATTSSMTNRFDRGPIGNMATTSLTQSDREPIGKVATSSMPISQTRLFGKKTKSDISDLAMSSNIDRTKSPSHLHTLYSNSLYNNSYLQSVHSNISEAPSFLRVYYKNLTAVVEKKPISLKESIANKLKIWNLDIANCVAYSDESNIVIDWLTLTNKITEQDLVIDLNEVVKHDFCKKSAIPFNFKSKFFSHRSCDVCKKTSSSLQINFCRKCGSHLCTSPGCVSRIESTVCSTRLLTSSPETLPVRRPKTRPILGFSFKRKLFKRVSNSNQIIPITDIKFISRHRTFSDPESFHEFDRNERHIEIKKKIESKRTRFDSNLLSWQLSSDQIQVKENNKIGQGSFGTVYKAVDSQHGLVAIKYLSNKANPNKINEFKNEVTILQSTEHENILTFIGCLLDDRLAIVTEWCQGSSLYNHIHIRALVDEWPINQIVDVATQVATGMEYLHSRNIIHCDLKSNNIFLVPINNPKLSAVAATAASSITDNSYNPKWKVKIGDFGVAKVKSAYENSEKEKCFKLDGSILWMAPEVIVQKQADPYTKRSDIYSYGIVLYELVAGKLPFVKIERASDDPMESFEMNNIHMLMYRIGIKSLRIDVNDARADTPIELKNLIALCADPDIDKRLDEFTYVLQILNNTTCIERMVRSSSFPNRMPEDVYVMMDTSENRSIRNVVSNDMSTQVSPPSSSSASANIVFNHFPKDNDRKFNF